MCTASKEMRVQKGFIEPGEKPKRFYKDVMVTAENGGFTVKLDGRNVRSPRGGQLRVPTKALAEMVAAEWDAQQPYIEIAAMHVTRLAFTAIEAVPQARKATAAQVAQYAATDLLCYFSEGGDSLYERQVAGWEPVLRRAEHELALAVQGGQLTLWLDGRTMLTQNNSAIPAGSLFLNLWTPATHPHLAPRIRKVEYGELGGANPPSAARPVK